MREGSTWKKRELLGIFSQFSVEVQTIRGQTVGLFGLVGHCRTTHCHITLGHRRFKVVVDEHGATLLLQTQSIDDRTTRQGRMTDEQHHLLNAEVNLANR